MELVEGVHGIARGIHGIARGSTWNCWREYMELLEGVHRIAGGSTWNFWREYMELLQGVHEIARGSTKPVVSSGIKRAQSVAPVAVNNLFIDRKVSMGGSRNSRSC